MVFNGEGWNGHRESVSSYIGFSPCLFLSVSACILVKSSDVFLRDIEWTYNYVTRGMTRGVGKSQHHHRAGPQGPSLFPRPHAVPFLHFPAQPGRPFHPEPTSHLLLYFSSFVFGGARRGHTTISSHSPTTLRNGSSLLSGGFV